MNLSDAEALLQQHELPQWVHDHTRNVQKLALKIADSIAKNGHPVDRDLVAIGATLHDIGRSLTQDPTHAVRGAELLRQADAPGPIIQIVARHTGAGLLPSDAQTLGLGPRDDLVPTTLEEKIVAHADNLYSGSKRLTLDAVVAKYDSKGLHGAGQRIVALHEALQDLAGVALDEL